MVDLIFVFKRFNTEKLCSKMAFVAGATKIKFINLKSSAKVDCFDAGKVLRNQLTRIVKSSLNLWETLEEVLIEHVD